MSNEGIFHDAHEVYFAGPVSRQWVATFASKELAVAYIRWQDDRDCYEVVPV